MVGMPRSNYNCGGVVCFVSFFYGLEMSRSINTF